MQIPAPQSDIVLLELHQPLPDSARINGVWTLIPGLEGGRKTFNKNGSPDGRFTGGRYPQYGIGPKTWEVIPGTFFNTPKDVRCRTKGEMIASEPVHVADWYFYLVDISKVLKNCRLCPAVVQEQCPVFNRGLREKVQVFLPI